MSFVDDHRATFDAREFSETITAGVGTGRVTSSLALRDQNAASQALLALQKFHALSIARDAPDVVGAYVTYSTGATELFTALMAISVQKSIANFALECLTSIVHYSMQSTRPQENLDAARSVVKEIVKARAVLVFDIFVHDQQGCAKKALRLLRLVAQCHPILAKEIVNRFDLGSDQMAKALCSERNDYCRIPFLDLMFALLTSGDPDVIWYVGSRSRTAIIQCLSTTAKRLKNQTEKGKSTFVTAETEKPDKVAPSHVQKRELIAAINLLLAMERHLLALPEDNVRRLAFASPVLPLLGQIAAAEIPPLQISPREVLREQEALRAAASRIFMVVAKDLRITNESQIVSALRDVSVVESKDSVGFVLDVINTQPRIAKAMLENGPYLSSHPRLSSAWFGHAAVISACVLRLPSPTTVFAQRKYLGNCLLHSAPLVQHFGVLITSALCKVVEADPSAVSQAEKYLPPMSEVELAVEKSKTAEESLLQLLGTYQTLFGKVAVEKKSDVVKLCMEATLKDISTTESSLQSCLLTAPREAVKTLLNQNYLSKLILRTMRTKGRESKRRLWALCRQVLHATSLFQHGSDSEIEVYLCVISGCSEEAKACCEAFEKLVNLALEMPYGLYDELSEKTPPNSYMTTSLFSVAALKRLKKLEELNGASATSASDREFVRILQRSLESIVSCGRVLYGLSGESFLSISLPAIVTDKGQYLAQPQYEHRKPQSLAAHCQTVQSLCSLESKYPMNAYLELVRSTSAMRILTMHGLQINSFDGRLMMEASLAWTAWCQLRKSSEPTLTSKFFSSDFAKSLTSETENQFNSISLGLLIQKQSDADWNADFADEFQRLENVLSPEALAFTTGILLRISSHVRTGTKYMSTAVEMVVDAGGWTKLGCGTIHFLRDSLLISLKDKHVWGKDEVHLLISHAANVFSSSGKSKVDGAKDQQYWISVLDALVNHKDDGVCIWSRMILSTLEIKALGSLSSLSWTSATQLAGLLPYSEQLKRICVAQISRLEGDALSRSLPALFPLLSRLLQREEYRDQKTRVDFSVEEVFGRLLQEASRNTKLWLQSQNVDSNVRVFETISDIGKSMAPPSADFELFMSVIRKFRDDPSQLSPNIWIFFCGVFRANYLEYKPSAISDGTLVELLSIVSEWFGVQKIELDNPAHIHALKVIIAAQRIFHSRKLAIYSLCKDTSAFERSLTGLCSNIMKSLHKAAGLGAADDDEEVEKVERMPLKQDIIAIPLQCLSEVLKFDLLLDKAAKRTLISLGAHEGKLIPISVQGLTIESDCEISAERMILIQSFAEMINMAVGRLPKFSLEADVAKSLGSLEQMLTEGVFQFSASESASDVAVRKAIQSVSICLRVNDAKNRYELRGSKMGYFREVASEVLPMFDSNRLQVTCQHVLGSSAHNSSHSLSFEGTMGRHSKNKVAALDAKFVLAVFLRACNEALKAPGSPILDYGRIAKDGLLGLAVSGIASSNEELRALSYACLHAFCETVGPFEYVPEGSASSLYRDRKQLSFLLGLLKQSIPESLVQVSPLFATWFRFAAKVTLSPTHAAYKAVTYFFLRSPVIDVFDCLGVTHLLRCDSFGAELKATRLLGLEIIRAGAHSRQDGGIIRKRKILHTLFLLAGSTNGFDEQVKIDALKTIVVLLEQDDQVGLSHDLLYSFGIIPWLTNVVPGRKSITTAIFQVKILAALARSRAKDPTCWRCADALSRALSVLVESYLSHADRSLKESLLENVVNAAQAICELAPLRRQLISLDIAKLGEDILRTGTDTARQQLLRVIAQQCESSVDVSVLMLLLRNCARGSAFSDSAANDAQVSMMHAFVAGSIIEMREQIESNPAKFQQLFVSVAGAVLSAPSVWLTLTGFCLLQWSGGLVDKLTKHSKKLPACPGAALAPNQELQFAGVVQKTRKLLTECLLQRSSHMETE